MHIQKAKLTLIAHSSLNYLAFYSLFGNPII